MVESGLSGDQTLVDVDYSPQGRLRSLPVEVLDRSDVLARRSDREIGHRQRVGFHLLMVCVDGRGQHVVDFEPVALSPGTCLRIRPGQVQRFVPEPAFEARLVLWPGDVHPTDPDAPAWYPGCDAATSWRLDDEHFSRLVSSIDDLRREQDLFDGSPRRIALMRSLLHALLLRLAIEVPASVPDGSRLPPPYVALRQRIEERLHQRPPILELARDLGYSTRTLDRACRQVDGRTAKQVLDQRVALEIRRLLTHTTRPVTRIAADFGFHDPSNFSRFVKRHLGEPPGAVRDGT